MANEPDKLILVSFLEPQPVGETFKRSRNNGWPFHITLVPWFEVEQLEALGTALTDLTETYRPFDIKLGAKEGLGPDKDIPANVADDQENIRRLHLSLLATVRTHARLLNDHWTGDRYQAHVTQHAGVPDNHLAGELVSINNVSMVKLISEDYCQVFRHYRLGSQA